MKWQDIDQQVCSVARTLSVIGDRWSMLIVRDAFLGTRRFADFQRQLGITRHRLADRLNRLVEEGIFDKVAYQDAPLRHEYRLTDKGLALHPILITMAVWGNHWKGDGQGAPVLYQHRQCGHTMEPQLCCPECNEPVGARDIVATVGPALAATLNDDGQYAAANGETVAVPPALRPATGSNTKG